MLSNNDGSDVFAAVFKEVCPDESLIRLLFHRKHLSEKVLVELFTYKGSTLMLAYPLTKCKSDDLSKKKFI